MSRTSIKTTAIIFEQRWKNPPPLGFLTVFSFISVLFYILRVFTSKRIYYMYSGEKLLNGWLILNKISCSYSWTVRNFIFKERVLFTSKILGFQIKIVLNKSGILKVLSRKCNPQLYFPFISSSKLTVYKTMYVYIGCAYDAALSADNGLHFIYFFVNTDDVCKCKHKSGGGVKTFGAVRGVLFYIYLILYSSYLCQSLSPFRYKEMHEWYLHSQKEEKNKIHCLPDDDDDMKKIWK